MTEGFLLGYPVEFSNLCLVYPPKVKDVVANSKYSVYLRLLTLSQEEIEDEYVKAGKDIEGMLTPFEDMLNNAYHNKWFEDLVHEAFLFFTREEVTLLYEQKMIVLGKVRNVKKFENLRILREDDFFEFQNLIRLSIGERAIEKPDPNEDSRVRAFKARARYRDRIKAKQGGGLDLKTVLVSICCMGLGLTPLNIGELSYAVVPLLFSTYQSKENYERDVDALLAGADSKKVKPKYWIRNSEEK